MTKPVIDDVLNCLRIEVSDITITLSARWESHWENAGMDFHKSFSHNSHFTHLSVSVSSSVGEREDWFHTLSRAIADHAAGLCTFGGPCSEVRGCFLNKAFMT